MRIFLLVLLMFVSKTWALKTYITGVNDSKSQPQSVVFLGGGGTDVDEAFDVWMKAAGCGDVVVLRTSGADGYNNYLKNLCAHSVISFVFESRKDSSDQSVLSAIEKAEAVFVAGGDQNLHLKYWKNTKLAQLLKVQIKNRKIAFGGTSAGAMILADRVFRAELGGVESDELMMDANSSKITISDGLINTFKGLMIDTHFVERDRMGRLAVFMNFDQPFTKLGLGIDHKTAVIFDSLGQGRVFGQGKAYVVKPYLAHKQFDSSFDATVWVRKYSDGDSINLTDLSKGYWVEWKEGEMIKPFLDPY